MPTIDLTPHRCHYCNEYDYTVKLCEGCMVYSCRDCKLGQDEASCYHQKKEIITGHDWTEENDKKLYD